MRHKDRLLYGKTEHEQDGFKAQETSQWRETSFAVLTELSDALPPLWELQQWDHSIMPQAVRHSNRGPFSDNFEGSSCEPGKLAQGSQSLKVSHWEREASLQKSAAIMVHVDAEVLQTQAGGTVIQVPIKEL